MSAWAVIMVVVYQNLWQKVQFVDTLNVMLDVSFLLGHIKSFYLQNLL